MEIAEVLLAAGAAVDAVNTANQVRTQEHLFEWER